MKKINLSSILYYVLMFCGVFFIASCQHNGEAEHHDHDEDEDEDEIEEVDEINHSNHNHDEDGIIHLSTKQAMRVGVEVDTLKLGTFHSVLHVGGRLLTTNSEETVVVASATGVATLSNATEGSPVSAGALLATISSDALEGGDAYGKAKVEFETAKKEYERAQSLLKDDIISQKQYETIELAYQQAKIAFQAYSSNSGNSGVKVIAKNSGYLKQWLIKQGEYVAVGQAIAVVSKNNKLQLVADVPACGFRQLQSFRSANFISSDGSETYSLDKMNGKLLSYGKSSSATSFVPITFEFDNKGNFLSDSYVEVFLLGKEEPNVLSIPLSAVTEEQGSHFVYVQECVGLYRKVRVTLGENDGERVKILAGLTAGDCLVVKGAYQVKLASMSSAIPEGHSHNH